MALFFFKLTPPHGFNFKSVTPWVQFQIYSRLQFTPRVLAWHQFPLQGFRLPPLPPPKEYIESR